MVSYAGCTKNSKSPGVVRGGVSKNKVLGYAGLHAGVAMAVALHLISCGSVISKVSRLLFCFMFFKQFLLSSKGTPQSQHARANVP